MKDKHYLLSVLGISALPRIITSALTFISFPILIRALGASNYGVIVYLGVIVSTFESFVDFGISSAAGKSIANARSFNFQYAEATLKKWAKLQLKAAVIGFLPLLIMTYIFSKNSKTDVSVELMILLVVSSWITICSNFIKATLNSLLAFKYVAIVDTTESIFRSISWIFVAYFVPTSKGLAIAQICTAFFVSIFAFFSLKRLIKIKNNEGQFTLERNNEQVLQTNKEMLKESLNFLWLRLITRIFQGVPMFLFGKYFGPSLVGIIGAFSKISEILNFPFSIIGNALAVKAQSIVDRGSLAIQKLWDTVLRILLLAFLITTVIYFLSDKISAYLLPGNIIAKKIISILSFSVLASIISSIIAPMSDYIGALKNRNFLMSIFTIVQFVAIYLISKSNDVYKTVIVYILILFLMNLGYISISIKAFFRNNKFFLKKEFIYTFFCICFSFTITHFLNNYLVNLDFHFQTVYTISVFLVMIFAFLLLNNKARKYLITRSFFDFHEQ